MKKLIAKLMTVLMVVSLFSTPVYAGSPDIVDVFVDNVFELEHKEQFVDLLAMIREVDDKDGMLSAYNDAFGRLTDGQQDRVESFGVTLDAMGEFVDYIMTESYDETKLNDYLGLDGSEDKAAFKASIVARETDFRSAMAAAGADMDALDDGFERMDKLFDMLGDAQLGVQIGVTFPFLSARSVGGSFTLVTSEADKLVLLANAKLDNDIEDGSTIIDGLSDFITYYNGTSSANRSALYDYLDTYGFVDYNPPSSGGGGSSGGGTSTPPTETIEDDPIAQAVPVVSESMPIAPVGGTVEFAESEVVMEVPADAFEAEVDITVEAFTEEDIVAGGSISAGFEDEDETLALSSQVYKFEATSTFDAKIKVSIPVVLEEGFTEFHKLGIYQFDEFLQEWVFVGGTYNAETGMVEVMLEHFSYYAVMSYDKSFTDIDASWAKEYITHLAAMRIINGRTETTYDPDGTLTRAEFAKLMVYVADLSVEATESGYTDVMATDWFAGSVTAAKTAGIVESVVVDKFRPNENITREEMVTMLMNLYKYMTAINYVETYKDEVVDFTDMDLAQAWAKEAIIGANKLEIVNGKGNDLFDPSGTATRAEAAKIVKILLDVLAK